MAMTVSRTRSWSRAAMPSRMAWLPRLLVMIRMVFLNDTVRPWLSVTRPSSRICSAQWTSPHSQNRFFLPGTVARLDQQLGGCVTWCAWQALQPGWLKLLVQLKRSRKWK